MTEKNEDSNPVLEVASESIIEGDEIYALDDGTLVKLASVPAGLINEIMSRIVPPPVPMVHLEDHNRDEPNPSDPDYMRAVEETDRKRNAALLDAAIMFGIQLVDGLPSDDKWLVRLKFLEKQGQISMKNYDLDDPTEKEFVYKKFSAPMWMINRAQELSSVSPQDVTKARGTFRGKKAR